MSPHKWLKLKLISILLYGEDAGRRRVFHYSRQVASGIGGSL